MDYGLLTDPKTPVDQIGKVDLTPQQRFGMLSTPEKTTQPAAQKPTPEAFKSLIVSKYPDGVSSSGVKYADMPARNLTYAIVQKYPDGVTSGGVKYADYLTPTHIGSDAASTLGQVGIGAAKTGASFVQGANVLDTMQRMQNGEGIDKSRLNLVEPFNALGATRRAAGQSDTWTGVEQPTPAPGAPSLFTGQTPDQQREAFTPSNTAQKVGSIGLQAALALSPVAKDLGPSIGKRLNTAADAVTPRGLRASTPQETAAASVSDAASATKHINAIAKDWQAPAETNQAGFNTVRKTLARSEDTPKFLGQQGIDARAHIVNGKYETLETADSLESTAGKLSSETLRPSLVQADIATPKTPAAQIKAPSDQYLKNTYNIPVDDAEKVSSLIQQKIDALDRKYPSGLGLTNMHDEKISFSSRGGFSPVNDPSVNNQAIANRAVADALSKTLMKTAPPELPIGEFNKELSKYYKAADYLRALNTKKAPATLIQMVARPVARFAGAAIGGHLGGGVVSEFAGYQIGKAIETSLENLSGQARRHFINNLQTTNPEAFAKVQDFLSRETSGNTGRPLLNAPRAIIPEAPSPESQFASRAATQKSESSPLIADQATARPPKTAISNQSIELKSLSKSIPQDAQKAIENHLTSAQQVIDNLPKESVETQLPQVLERTKINIADGLEAQGYKNVAEYVRKFVTTPFKSLVEFVKAFKEYIKSIPNKQGGFVRIQPREAKTQRFTFKDKMDVKRLTSHEGAPDAHQVEHYRKQIRAGNDIEPIKVIKEGNKYGIEDGKHRYQAFLEEGYNRVPVEVIEPSPYKTIKFNRK